MCMKLKTLRVVFRIYSPYILRFLCFVSFVAIIVIFSKYSYDASSLQSRMSEKKDYVSASPNKKIYQIISDWYLKASDNNVSVIKINNTGSNIEKEDKDEEVGEDEFPSTFEQETDNYNDDDNFDADEPTVATKVPVTSEKKKTVCKPEPPRSDFSECGNRIADRKCCEYIWEWKYKKELLERKKCLSKGRHTVVGGEEVQPGEYPHMAAIGFQLKKDPSVFEFKCGGSLISEQYVLTAGHCTKVANQHEYLSEPTQVQLGVVNIKMFNGGVKVAIENITQHPNYIPPKPYFDIALVRLYKTVTFTYNVHPACLSTDLSTQIKTANVTGWGKTQYDSDRGSDHLLVATLKVLEHETCHEIFEDMGTYNRNFEILRHSQICASADKQGDTCQGDSGGPLQERINTTFGNIHRVYGVTSSGTMCGIGIPATYVKVAAAITWIENIVWPEYKNHTNYKT